MSVLGMTKLTPAIGIMAIVAALSVASTRPAAEPATTGTSGVEAADEDCRFAILARNSLSFDVWVMLYDSSVKRPDMLGWGVFSPMFKQMKIQNQRISPGGTMNRRYTAAGKCSAKRIWHIKVVRGDPGKVPMKTLEFITQGTGSGSRTVDLGRSSRWDPID